MWLINQNEIDDYNEVVRECLIDEDTFSTFKSNRKYNRIVGMSEPRQLEYFMAKIKEHPDVCDMFDIFRKNDIYGSPIWIDVESNLSLNTIRYIYSLCDIKEKIGPLEGLNICELGVGYGGLAFILNSYDELESYTLIDLPRVEMLAEKYLRKLGISVTTNIEPKNIDLFISEFCLSEFDDEQMYEYYDKYIKDAKNVYLVMNLMDPERKNKFINKISQDFYVEVYPETHGNIYPCYTILGKKLI